jgi:2-dehydro-3-deoxyphosphogluconate aldolase/(4S)-4-hydroxy-2-oxoglutarate aldolase
MTMIDRAAVLQTLMDNGLIAVVRSNDSKPLLRALHAVLDGGVSIVEVTLTVPNALQVIAEAKREFGARVLLGAGTVLEVETARAAVEAGASFVVSPVVVPEVISDCVMREVPVIPGAFTPTEIVTAWNAGADIVKVFPAGNLGPEFFKAMKGPLPHIRLMPTGGVDQKNALAFLEAGAVCLGIGTQLVDPKLVAAGDTDALRDRAAQFAAIVKKYRKKS